MKFIHLSDLHLGKRVNEFSMIEDQSYILDKILKVLEEEKPDAILITGDVYDKSIPSSEAVALCSRFLRELAERKFQVFLSSGNHDGAERLAFAWELIDVSGVHISPVYDGAIQPYTLWDSHGPVDIYMLPFVKPAVVRHCFPEEEISSYTDAVRTAISHMPIDNILVLPSCVDAVKITAFGNLEQLKQFFQPIGSAKVINHLGLFWVFQMNQIDAACFFSSSTAFSGASRSI